MYMSVISNLNIMYAIKISIKSPEEMCILTVTVLCSTDARHILIRIQVNFKCTYVHTGMYSYRM